MLEEENIAVDSSVNSLMEETPSEPTVTETPTESVETVVEPTEPPKELFELPDGRKVDGETLAKEWKENFLPDYTRKSQELAKTKTENLQTNEPKENPYENPDYIPQSYEELLKVAEERAIAALDAREQAKVEHQQAIENEVIKQLTDLKSIDPALNENALFLHANKYGFRDLKLAHANMKDMADVIKKTQDITAQNIAKRTDPVSVIPGAGGQKLDPDNFRNAVEYLRALKSTE